MSGAGQMNMVVAMQAIYWSTRAQVRGKGMSAGHGWGDFAQAFYCRGHDGFCSVQLSISPKFAGVSSHVLDPNEGGGTNAGRQWVPFG